MFLSIRSYLFTALLAFLLIWTAWAGPAGGTEWEIGRVPTADHEDTFARMHNEPWHTFQPILGPVDGLGQWDGDSSSSPRSDSEWREVSVIHSPLDPSWRDRISAPNIEVYAEPEQQHGSSALQQAPEQRPEPSTFQQAPQQAVQQSRQQPPMSSTIRRLLEHRQGMIMLRQARVQHADVSTHQPTPEGRVGQVQPEPQQPSWFSEDAARLLGVKPERLAQAQETFDKSGEKWETWKGHMRAVLGRPRLFIWPNDLKRARHDRVFVAVDGDPVAGLYPPLDADEQAARRSDGRYLLQLQFPPGKLEHRLSSHDVRQDKTVFVYLNSRSNMDFINREYFLGHAQFLLIHKDGLERHTLTKIFLHPRNQFVIPPRRPFGLPLVVLRHFNPGHRSGSWLEKLTGNVGKTKLMSLWSPMLWDGQRFTMFLHGIVTFDDRFINEVRTHLHVHSLTWRDEDYASGYGLSEQIHTLSP